MDKIKEKFYNILPGGPKKPDIVIKHNDYFLQSMGKIWNSIKIQFKGMGKRISGTVKKGWEKRDLLGKMLICICAIPAAPVILIGLFIESLVESIKALCNVYDASMKATE
jgi:hypothetical protein